MGCGVKVSLGLFKYTHYSTGLEALIDRLASGPFKFNVKILLALPALDRAYISTNVRTA